MKKVLALVMAALISLSMAACGDTSSSAGSVGSRPEASSTAAAAGGALTGTLKLGFIGPITGDAALYGTAAANGAQIAADEINALGTGFTIEYDPRDDENDAGKSVDAYNALKERKAQAIVGCVTSASCAAVGAEAYADRMFMLTPSASAASVSEGKDNVFRLCTSDTDQGPACAQYIADNALATKVAVIYNNSDVYSTGIYNTFAAKADELGLEIVSVTTFTDDTADDFSVQLTEAQKAGADLLFLPIYYTPASLIFRQADSMGYAPVFFGTDGMDGILSLEGFDTSLAEGAFLLTSFSADAADEPAKSFAAGYTKLYGETPSQFAADGYDCVYAIYYALTQYAAQNGGYDVTDVSYAELCEVLISVFAGDFTYSGLTGEGMTWTAEGEVNKIPGVVVIKNGTYAGFN